LAEGFEAAAAVGVLRIEREPLLRGEGLDRNDVPGAGGDDVDGEDVDFGGGVGRLVPREEKWQAPMRYPPLWSRRVDLTWTRHSLRPESRMKS